MERFAHSIILVVLVLSGLQGCGFYEEKPQKGADPSLSPAEATQISYQMVASRVFAANCIACHGNSGGVNLESYASVKANLDKIERAALVSKTMPKGKTLGREEARLLAAWIKAGAPENPTGTPPGSGDEPLKPNFASIKKKIIDIRCITCHANGGPAAGVPLKSLKDILSSPRDLVLPGNPDESGLVIAVSRSDSKRMPPPETGNPLSADEIAIIRKWIELGAPESDESGPGDRPPVPEEPLKSTYSSIQKKIFEVRCISCHTQGGPASGAPLKPWKDLVNSPRDLVLPGNPDESGLIIELTRQDSKRMPPPSAGAALSDAEVAAIKKWIQEGAKED